MCLLQVWAIFAKFGEIHLFSPPKNLRKFRQPLDALRGHLTKSQLQIFFLHAKSFRRTPEGHCYCQVQKVQCTVSVSRCRFLQNLSSISPVAAVAPCALCLLLIPAPHDRLEACGRRRRAGGGAPPRERRQQRPLRLPERGAALDGAVQRRPSHQRQPRGHPLTCARRRSIVVNW